MCDSCLHLPRMSAFGTVLCMLRMWVHPADVAGHHSGAKNIPNTKQMHVRCRVPLPLLSLLFLIAQHHLVMPLHHLWSVVPVQTPLQLLCSYVCRSHAPLLMPAADARRRRVRSGRLLVSYCEGGAASFILTAGVCMLNQFGDR
jgi:hypothetical protein